MVQTNTVDALERAMLASFALKAPIVTCNGARRHGRWCYLDPRLGAMHAVAEAARKVACAGATPSAPPTASTSQS